MAQKEITGFEFKSGDFSVKLRQINAYSLMTFLVTMPLPLIILSM